MRKTFRVLRVIMVFFIILYPSLEAVASSELSTNKVSHEFHGIEFEIPSDWTQSDSGDENINYFYPQHGIVMFNYQEGFSIASEAVRESFKVGIEETNNKLENERILTNSGDYNDGYLYDFEISEDGELFKGILLIFDYNGGFVAVICATSTLSTNNHTDKYYEVLSSMGFERKESVLSENEGPFHEEDYEKAYVVEFKLYNIYYLVDEDNKTITIVISNEPEFESVSNYTGDFNNGVDFDWDGLRMHAHYKYWDNASSIIVYDETGNENYARSTNVYQVVDLLNKHH